MCPHCAAVILGTAVASVPAAKYTIAKIKLRRQAKKEAQANAQTPDSNG